MIVAESPGPSDVRERRPMASPGGAELSKVYLPIAGVRLEDCYITYVRKCLTDYGKRNPTHVECSHCASTHLYTEIAAVNPDIIVTLGSGPAHVFGRSLGRDHGIITQEEIPLPGRAAPWVGYVFPTFSQNAGLSAADADGGTSEDSDSYMVRLVYDFEALADFIRTGVVVEDPYPSPDYREITTPEEWWDYLEVTHPKDGFRLMELGMDTESDTRYRDYRQAPPWCLTASVRPGSGVLIHADNTHLLGLVGSMMAPRGHRPLVVLHNSLYDLDVLRRMGIHVERFSDNLLLCFELGIPSKGLKYLTRRYLGMAMSDFEDVVRPASVERGVLPVLTEFMEYYAAQHAFMHTFKSGARKGQQEVRWPKSLPDKGTYNKVAALFRDLGDPDKDTDPWERYSNWADDGDTTDWDVFRLYTSTPWPKASIWYVDRPQAVRYACMDADATLRMRPILRRLARELRRRTWAGGI